MNLPQRHPDTPHLETLHLDTAHGSRIAYVQVPGESPGVVFLGGLRSDMTGIKAAYLQDWSQQTGRAFLRFDYSGHGASSGTFEDGHIGDWFADAAAVITQLTDGPQVLVGSSVGGWISLLCARAMPDRVAGLVTVAAAPDFTEDVLQQSLSPAEQETLVRDGRIERPSEYSDEPDVITHSLIEEARDHLVLRRPLALPFPVRCLHGTADTSVPMSVALRLLEHADGDDLRLTLVKGADHRFSDRRCLTLLVDALEDVLSRI
ncbi:MAG: alpha/beta hydrolase [Micrococcales bacterium]|nr:MAG: alpha/beta hydrolase [Micrococcales bacterium]